MGGFEKLFDKTHRPRLEKLNPRLQCGIKEELLPLVQRGVGRVRGTCGEPATGRCGTCRTRSGRGLVPRPDDWEFRCGFNQEQLGKEVKAQELAGQTVLSEFGE